ncbi:terminase large subunit [Enterococcus mundtii]|uniref:terminase large subunit n=1 Tax=Enterococcus mundtii TaxID=53346 RepID=UPI0003C5540C|nr:terminase TerL endonuclease subunit [Enterococcus mundtii]EYT95539.1 terminase large subunit [Enterococcus mundtii CRL35]MCA6775064.1 terminase large subunit [Enterococcus mundtii]MDV7743647.1 terminase large subunit [Enterococcus mundtii]BAO06348.1 bacteriophage terminase large subunit [Enterococcus mundtii QU 25]
MIDYQRIPNKLRDDTYAYAVLIVERKIISCKKVYDACIRHLKDLLKIPKLSWKYNYDPVEAAKAIEFLEMLPDVKTGKTYPLADFQRFIIGSIYGWRSKNNRTIRRFKKAFISVARKNGKTILIAGIVLYEFLFAKNPALSRQIFCTANDKKQASIAFDMARKQLDALRSKYPDIRKATKRVREFLKNLRDESYITVLSKETGAIDGFEPYIGVFDEYGASKTDEMMELIESGQGQLDNPLILIISTANFNLNVPMYRVEYPRMKDILEETLEDEEQFIYIAEQESIKELEQPEMYIKSNPILSVSALHEKMMTNLKKRWKAGKEKGTTIKIMVKNFNMWSQSSDEAYLSADHWKKALIDKPDIKGKKVWFGIDVGRTSDLFSISWVVHMGDYFYVDSFSFIATKYGLATKEKRDGISYTNLQMKNECKITDLESGVIDYDETYEWLEQFIYENDLDVQCIAFDPHQYGHILTLIEKNHPEWLQAEVRQTSLVLNMPTKQFRDDVINLKIRHSGNELLTAAIYNAITKVDNNGMRIDKNKNSNKIDPIDALLDAYAMCYTEFQSGGYWTDEKILGGDFGF